MHAWVNGRLLDDPAAPAVTVSDHGFTVGDGVFEAVKVVDGQPFALPRGIELSAYRIVQEGLTNALKHAHASDADVIVRYRPDELEIEVRDNGRGGATSDGQGHGLVGVRERVKIYGGEMSAGRSTEGGFVLSTRLPVAGERP